MNPKSAKFKIILSLSIIAIIVIVILVLFFFTDIFRTKKGAFFRYLKMTESGLEVLNDSEEKEYKTLKETMPYITNAQMIVKTSSNVADSSIMDKLKLTMQNKVNSKEEKANYKISINSGNDELFNMSLAQEKNNYAFYSPAISNTYIGIKNENLQSISKAIIGDYYIPNEILEVKMDKLLEMTDVERNHINSYYNLLKNVSPDASFTKSSNFVEVEENKYKTTSYTLSLSGEQSAEVQISLLSKLSQDSIMMDFITSKCKLLNLSEKYTDINTLNINMQERIENLKLNPQSAEKIEITVDEYKQKNIQTTIKINDNIISIIHLKDGEDETLTLKFNEVYFLKGKTGDSSVIKFGYTKDDIEKSIKIVNKVEGTIEENNISNVAEITTTNGIKKVIYSYKDDINFTNDIGTIETFNENDIAILNKYSVEEIEPFVKALKNRINDIYISKGAQIGINLDPIFQINE